MKKLTLFLSFSISLTASFAQDFPGFLTGNYSGVTGVLHNPASIADSRYKWDVNLLSFSTWAGNDKATFSMSDLGGDFSLDSITNQLFDENAGRSNASLNMSIMGPSGMFNINRRLSLAVSTRARAFVNAFDLDGKLVNKLTEDFANDPSLPYTISSEGDMMILENGWSEIGVTAAGILYEKGPHFIKGGITLKYLAGASNAYFNLNNFDGTIDQDLLEQDVFLRNSSGRIGLGFGGTSLDDFKVSDLTSFESSGFGTDIGFVYEFRPDYQAGTPHLRSVNKYKLKVGVSLLDVGAIKYQKDLSRSGSYDINIDGAEKLYFSEFDDISIDDYKDFLDSHPEYFTAVAGNDDADYKVGLPTTLQLDVDYHIYHNFYVSAGGQFALNKNSDKPFSPQYYNRFAVTPRFENRNFGVFLPIAYNELSDFSAGLSLRLGPVFLGSGSIISSLLGDSKQADVHLGVGFGILQKK